MIGRLEVIFGLRVNLRTFAAAARELMTSDRRHSLAGYSASPQGLEKIDDRL